MRRSPNRISEEPSTARGRAARADRRFQFRKGGPRRLGSLDELFHTTQRKRERSRGSKVDADVSAIGHVINVEFETVEHESPLPVGCEFNRVEGFIAPPRTPNPVVMRASAQRAPREERVRFGDAKAPRRRRGTEARDPWDGVMLTRAPRFPSQASESWRKFEDPLERALSVDPSAIYCGANGLASHGRLQDDYRGSVAVDLKHAERFVRVAEAKGESFVRGGPHFRGRGASEPG